MVLANSICAYNLIGAGNGILGAADKGMDSTSAAARISTEQAIPLVFCHKNSQFISIFPVTV